MEQWARLSHKPLMKHQSLVSHSGPSTLTGNANSGSFHRNPKHEKMVASVVSPPTSSHPNEAAPPPSREVTDGLEHDGLSSWTPLIVSESEESANEPLSRVNGVQSSKTRRKKTRKSRKARDHGPSIAAVSRQQIQQASSRISGIESEPRNSPEPPGLREALQETFDVNIPYNISPPGTPSDREGSSIDLPAVSNMQRPRLQSTYRSTNHLAAVVDGPAYNATTAVKSTASRKVVPSIPYESLQEVIDAALDTRIATITWGRRHHATRNSTDQKSDDGTPKSKRVPFEPVMSDLGCSPAAHLGYFNQEFNSGLPSVEDEHRGLPLKSTQMLDCVQTQAVPWQSRGEKFNERLEEMFGGAEQAHSPAPEWIYRATTASKFTPAHEVVGGKALSPVSSSDSESTTNTSLAQSTKATSVASGRDDVSQKRAHTESDFGNEHVRKKQKVQVDEDRVFDWTTALQRLVKGKTKIDRKGMDDLSVILAEVESVYPHIDSTLTSVSCLQNVLQRLAHLEDIPFRDEHDLRRRAEDAFAERLNVIP